MIWWLGLLWGCGGSIMGSNRPGARCAWDRILEPEVFWWIFWEAYSDSRILSVFQVSTFYTC